MQMTSSCMCGQNVKLVQQTKDVLETFKSERNEVKLHLSFNATAKGGTHKVEGSSCCSKEQLLSNVKKKALDCQVALSAADLTKEPTLEQNGARECIAVILALIWEHKALGINPTHRLKMIMQIAQISTKKPQTPLSLFLDTDMLEQYDNAEYSRFQLNNREVDASQMLLSWLLRFAAQVMNKKSIGTRRKTSEFRLTGRTWKNTMAQLGEIVWFRKIGEGGVNFASRTLHQSLLVIMIEREQFCVTPKVEVGRDSH